MAASQKCRQRGGLEVVQSTTHSNAIFYHRGRPFVKANGFARSAGGSAPCSRDQAPVGRRAKTVQADRALTPPCSGRSAALGGSREPPWASPREAGIRSGTAGRPGGRICMSIPRVVNKTSKKGLPSIVTNYIVRSLITRTQDMDRSHRAFCDTQSEKDKECEPWPCYPPGWSWEASWSPARSSPFKSRAVLTPLSSPIPSTPWSQRNLTATYTVFCAKITAAVFCWRVWPGPAASCL